MRTGDSVALVVAEDVSSGGKIVIAKDAPAVGKVQLAGMLAFMASRWIRGDDVTIAPETVFEAHVGLEEAAASPAPSASP